MHGPAWVTCLSFLTWACSQYPSRPVVNAGREVSGPYSRIHRLEDMPLPPTSPFSFRRCQGPELDLVSGLVTPHGWSWDRHPPVALGKRLRPLHQQMTELLRGRGNRTRTDQQMGTGPARSLAQGSVAWGRAGGLADSSHRQVRGWAISIDCHAVTAIFLIITREPSPPTFHRLSTQ